MTSLIRADSAWCDDQNLWVGLSDGRRLGVPLTWFPRLMRATKAQRDRVTISTRGLHWEDLDEDISIDGLLKGNGDQTRPRPAAEVA